MSGPKILDLGDSAGASLDRASITFVGTATVILRWGALTLLTDPNFLHEGDHVHLGYGLTSERLTDPAIDFDALPPIDLDRLVQERLDRAMPIVTTPSAARRLGRLGFRAVLPLATWESLLVRRGETVARLTAMPGKHAPGPLQLLIPPTMGTLVELDPGSTKPYRIYVTGDTLLHDGLREIPRRYPEIELMLIHLGGTRILGVLLTMDAKQGIELVKIVAPATTIPIHFDDYAAFRSPLADFLSEVRAAGLEDRVHRLERGESFSFEVAGGEAAPREAA
jgi:L-ascorbate metabolism protein UlaG (beta-lactamase superfamily)